MIHLKKFNESSEELWKEIDYDEYAHYSTVEEFSQGEIDAIKKIVNPTERKIHFNYDGQSEHISIYNRTVIYSEDINIDIY